MREIAERLAQSDLGSTSLDAAVPLATARGRAFRVSAADDGFSVLAPDKFIELRLLTPLHAYQAQCKEADKAGRLLRTSTSSRPALNLLLLLSAPV